MFPGFIYILCAVTCLGCAALLLRGNVRKRDGLRFWTALCFVAMAVNHVLLYLNFIVLPDVELLFVARIAMLIGVVLLNFGLIWHST